MGASQSSGADSGGGGDDAEVKTSYYELLGIERTATEDEIKKAYRRKALELHPDRNYGDVERTTALFAEVQSAYEVLSDPQERAWYDAHEGDILRGGSGEGGGEAHYEGNMKVTTADDLARMMGKFRGKVDFSDSPNGFYGFLRETFAQLAKEEEHAGDWEGVDVPEYPSFGHKDDTYEDVVRGFYAVWNGFSTRKSFAWKDLYRTSDAPDRRVRRLAEKENKRAREEGVREFNDAVRTLVQFVRKRDPRYTPNTQTEAERAREQRAKTKAQAQRARAAHAAKVDDVVPEWATRRDVDEELEETEEESEEEHFECVACHKTFKSERQYEAHERSKKHQKAVQALKKKMRKDNAHLHLDEDVTSSGAMTPGSGDEELTGDGDQVKLEYDSAEDVADDIKNIELEDELEEEGDRDDATTHDHSQEERPPPSKPDQDEDEESESSSTDEDDDYASRSTIQSRLNPSSSTNPSTTSPDPSIPPEPQDTTPKLGKAAQKRLKKAAKQASDQPSDLPHRCVTCNTAFPSKTQLFAHIKDWGHAAPVATLSGKGPKGRKR